MWEKFVEFLKEYDTQRIAQTIREIDWVEVAKSPLAWLAVLAFLGYVLWKQKIRLLVVVVSVAAFIYLLQMTLPSAGEDISPAEMVKFVGGCMGLLAVNAYFFLMRD
jgi:hypothetical protein